MLMRFETPWAFLLFAIVPLTLLRFGRGARVPALRFSSAELAKGVGSSLKQQLSWIPSALRCLSLSLLIIALARPQRGVEQVREVSEGVAIMMVVDRSGSMAAEMELEGRRMTRLDVVKQVLAEFVSGNKKGLSGRQSDLIGMVTFARYADTACPLTLAHGALDQFLKSVQIVKQEAEDGTAIGDALALASARLKTAEETLARQSGRAEDSFKITSKVIVLLTDGRHNIGERSPAQAAALAKEWGIKIYTVGVGGEEGMLSRNGIFGAFLLPAGEGVDKKTLKMLADNTGGIFWMAEDGEGLREIYREIDGLEKSRVESMRYLDYQELFLLFSLSALVLILLEIFLGATVFRRIP